MCSKMCFAIFFAEPVPRGFPTQNVNSKSGGLFAARVLRLIRIRWPVLLVATGELDCSQHASGG